MNIHKYNFTYNETDLTDICQKHAFIRLQIKMCIVLGQCARTKLMFVSMISFQSQVHHFGSPNSCWPFTSKARAKLCQAQELDGQRRKGKEEEGAEVV